MVPAPFLLALAAAAPMGAKELRWLNPTLAPSAVGVAAVVAATVEAAVALAAALSARAVLKVGTA
jgi:hypothetical protein